ncbi:hypothetical protein N2152v2_006474 [Parachlorella kessleri]
MQGAVSKVILLAFLASIYPSKAQTPEVVLYGEALCPYTIAAVKDVIGPLFDGGLAGRFTFRYVAYGNARTSSAGVTCQHGPAECRLNRVINCAEELSTSDAQFMAFLRCVAQAGRGGEAAVDGCAKAAKLSPEDISQCATGEDGGTLERKAAAETGALRPAHTYVPWLVVNGVPLGEDDVNLYKYICVASGQDKPEECLAPPDPSAKALFSTRMGAEGVVRSRPGPLATEDLDATTT